jgi:cyclic lactone autoinducer peptide
MKTVLYRLLTLSAGLISLVAAIGAGTASWLEMYQPREPKCLRK